jgi:hypothetical protein
MQRSNNSGPFQSARVLCAMHWAMLCVLTLAHRPAMAQTLAQSVPAGTAPSNTTVVPRSATDAATNQAQVTLIAQLTDDGQVIDQGVTWRIYAGKVDANGRMVLATQSKDASPKVKLDPGDYVVNVAFGRAHLTRRVTLTMGQSVTEKFVLNAGGLKLQATLSSGEPAPDKTVIYDIFSDERDQFGQRIKVMTGAKPGLIIRLNAGIYRIVSTYGDANATVNADLAVEPGKLTEATVIHAAAKVTLKLVTRAGGEAIADTQWSITNSHGDVVKESAGALPSHVLAAGNYTATAKSGSQTFRRDFGVKGGDVVFVEVVAN